MESADNKLLSPSFHFVFHKMQFIFLQILLKVSNNFVYNKNILIMYFSFGYECVSLRISNGKIHICVPVLGKITLPKQIQKTQKIQAQKSATVKISKPVTSPAVMFRETSY
jgi:hypothetical protein